MKRYLLPLLLAAAFIFAGFNKSNAAVTLTPASTAGMAPVSPAILPSATSAGLVLAGTTITNTGAASISFEYMDFTASAKPNTYFSAFQLWVNTTGNTFAGATQVAGAGTTMNSTTDSYFTSAQTVPAGASYTYFFVATYSAPPATNTNWTLTNVDFETAGGVYYTTTNAYTYILPAAATASVTGTATSTSTVAGSGGTSSPATISTPGTYTIQGTKIVASTTAAASKAITALTFTTSNANGNSYFYGTAYLFAGTATGPTGSAIATVTTTASTTLNFTGLTGQYLAYNSTLYYYVEIVYSSIAASATTTLSFTSATGPTITNGAVAGPAYTFNPPPFALTINSVTTTAGANGLSATPIPYPSSNYAVAVFNLVGSGGTGTTTINSLTFTQNGTATVGDNNFYTTAYLYSSTSATYVPGTTNVAGNLVGTATSDGTTNIVFTTSISTSNTTNMYYFVVLADDLGYNTANTFRIHYSSATTSSTAVTAGAATNGPAYTFTPVTPVVITLTSLTTTAGSNGLSATPIPTSSTNYGVYGFSLVASGNAATTGTINSLTFIQNGTSTSADNTYYTTAYLYSSTTNTYVPGTTNVPGNLVSTATSDGTSTIVFPTTINVSKSSGTVYYFIVLADDLNNYAPNPNTFRLTYSTDTYTTIGTTNGATIAGPAYTFQGPTITASDVPAADLTVPTAIYVGQQNIVVAGIGLSVNIGSTTLTKLTFSFTPAVAATLAKYFSNTTVRLMSSTSALTAPVTYGNLSPLVTSAGFTFGAGTISVTVPGTTINTTPTYFYLVVDYTVTGGATNQTFTFTPTGYTTALSTGTTAYASNTFTCTTPTYYWTGAAGDNNWTTANNWEVTTTAPVLVNGYYPGQIYAGNAASTQDNVIISPVQTTPTIGLTANVTIATLTNSAGVTTALNINSGVTLTTGYFTIGATSGTSASAITLAGGGTLTNTNTGTASTINYAGTLTVATNGNYTVGAGAEISVAGATSAPAKFILSGGTISGSGANFYLNGTSASLQASAGTFNATNQSTIVFNNTTESIVNNGATFNITDPNVVFFTYPSNTLTNNSGTFNVTDANSDTYQGFLVYQGSVNVTGGTFNLLSNATDVSDMELGLFDLFDGYLEAGTLSVTGGSFNVSGGSYIHQAYTGSTITNNGGNVVLTTGSYIYSDFATLANTSGTMSFNASAYYLGGTVGENMTNAGTFTMTNGSMFIYYATGSTATNTGTLNFTNSTLNFASTTGQLNSTAGAVNLGAGSTALLANNNDKITNSGTSLFTCSPTAIINLTAASTAAKAPTITNSGNGVFTLMSSSTGSTTIGKIATIGTNGSFIGQFNVQRYISTASRNYRLLSSQVNETAALSSATGANLTDISQLGKSVTSPATFNGAFIGGPGAGFTNYVANPLLYVYQESILPGTTENKTFTSGKNVGISGISAGSPYLETTTSTAAGGTTASDNSTTVKIPAGNAYLLYYIHDNTSTSVTSPLDTATTTATGYINQGSVPFLLWGTGTLTTALTYTTGTGALYPGVTMVGNPYASTIDLKQVYTDNAVAANIFTAGTGEAFYELDPSTEQFVSYNYNGTTATTSGSNASEYIASGQGFYVSVLPTKAGKIFTFNEDQKTTSTTTPVFPSPLLESVIPHGSLMVDNVSKGNIKTTNAVLHNGFNTANSTTGTSIVSSATSLNAVGGTNLASGATVAKYPFKIATTKPFIKPDTTTTVTPPTPPAITGMHLKLVQDSVTYDECGLYFNKAYSDNFDNNDAADLDGTGGKVFLSSYTANRVRTSINALGNYAVTGGKRVPLFVKFSTAGIYKLQLEDIANFASGSYSVFLLDKMLNDSLDLTLYKSYNFNYAPGTANDSTRFVLAIEHKPVPYYALVSFAGQKVTQGVQLDWTVKNEFNTTKFVVQKLQSNGSYAFLDSLSSDSSGLYSYVDQHPSLGSNTYRLQQTTELGAITYSNAVTIGYNSTSPNGGLNIYPNPARSAITVTLTTSTSAAQVATADIYSTSGTLIEHIAVNSNSFNHDVSSYQLGVYIIELKNSNGNLVGKSKFVKVQ